MGDFNETDSLNEPGSVYLSETELDAMTTEELEAALALALDSMTDQSYDGNVISAYLDALERKSPMPEYPDAETSYGRFKKKLQSINHSQSMKHNHRISRRALTVFIAAVLVLCLLTAQALGADIFGKLARWTADTFSFGMGNQDIPEQETYEQTQQETHDGFSDTLPLAYQEFWDELGKHNVPGFLYPTYIPEDFQLDDYNLRIYPESDAIHFTAWYVSEDNEIAFSILYSSNNTHRTFEKDLEDVDIYEINDIEHYFFCNNGKNVVAWVEDNLEYSLSSTIPVSELKAVLESMYLE